MLPFANAVAAWGAKQAADVAKDALAAAQRPWVGIAISKIGDLEIKNGNGRIDLDLILTNSGQSPATNIRVRGQICDPNGAPGVIQKMSQNARQEAARKRNVPISATFGFSLFPKESTPYTHRFSFARRDIVQRLMHGKTAMVAPSVVGLVSYFSPIDRTEYQTGFIYLLVKTDKENPGLFPLDDNLIPGDRLYLKRTALSGYVD